MPQIIGYESNHIMLQLMIILISNNNNNNSREGDSDSAPWLYIEPSR